MKQAADGRLHVLPDDLRLNLVALINDRGLRVVANEFGMSPQTVASLGAGIKVNASMVALATRRMSELAGAGRR